MRNFKRRGKMKEDSMKKERAKKEKVKKEKVKKESDCIEERLEPYEPLNPALEPKLPRESLFKLRPDDPLGKDPERKRTHPNLENQIVVLNAEYPLDEDTLCEKVQFENRTKIQQVFYNVMNDPVRIPPGRKVSWLRTKKVKR